jgi:hypothetical protein
MTGNTTTEPSPQIGACKLSSVLGLTPLIELYGEAQQATTSTPARDAATDPLSLFILEEAAQKAGDLGVDIRTAANAAKSEVTRLASEIRGPLLAERAFFEVNNPGTSTFSGWIVTIETQSAEAIATLDAVHVAGLNLSADFKSGAAEETEMTQAKLTETQTATQTNEALEHYKTELMSAYQPVKDEIAKCLRWDYTEAVNFDAILEASKRKADASQTVTDYVEAKDRAEVIAREIANLIAEKQNAYKTEYAKLGVIFEDVKKKIERHSGLEGLVRGSLTDEQLTLTKDKINAAIVMAKSGSNLKAVEAAMDVALEAQVLINAIDDPTASETLKAVSAKLTETEKMLNKHASIRSTDSAALLKKLTSVKSDIRSMAPATAQSTVDGFAASVLTSANPGDWTTYQGRAQLQIKWKTDYEAKAKLLEAEVAKFSGVFPGGYSGSLLSDVKTLTALVQTEAVIGTGDEAAALVTRIEQKIASYEPALVTDGSNPEAFETALLALNADQDEAERLAEAEAAAKKTYEDKLAALDRKISAASDVPAFSDMIDSVPTSAADFQGCKQMRDSAKTTAKDSKDYKTAVAMLDAAERDLAKLVKRSTGELFTDLNQIGRAWQIGALGFASKVTELKTAMGKAIEDMAAGEDKTARETQITQTNKALDDLVTFFQPTAFEDCAARFATLTAVKERKREREEVLRRVRLYRDAITSNPMMKTVVTNPFGVTGIASGLFAQLKKIELMTLATL